MPRASLCTARPPASHFWLLLAPLVLALQACCVSEPREALDTPPDIECQTGVEVGFDIAIWECVQDEHVVAYRRSAAIGTCSGVTMERAPCGQLTAFEQANSDELQRECATP